MQKLISSTGALVLGFALASAPALAQNMQGPGAANFGLTSSPQTGGATNTAPNAISPQPLYNYAPSNPSGQAKHGSRHATSGYRR
jgi:hypothetical protein